jgi:hypothetical protein
MRTVRADALPRLRQWFTPEQPGPMIFEHVARTGHGRCRVDRWPDPRVVLAELPGHYALRGDPSHLDDSDLANVMGSSKRHRNGCPRCARWIPRPRRGTG